MSNKEYDSSSAYQSAESTEVLEEQEEKYVNNDGDILADIREVIEQMRAKDPLLTGESTLSRDRESEMGVYEQAILDLMPTKRKRRWKQRVSGILFYLVLIAVVAGVFNFMDRKGGGPKTLFGYSVLHILTESMQSEIPKGSLVLIRMIDPNTVKIGDDITYMVSDDTSITHKVIGIYENHEDSGMRFFETMGVDNDAPDKELVAASNVLGKVVGHVPHVGRITSFVSGNALMLFVILVGMGGLIYAILLTLRWLFRPQT